MEDTKWLTDVDGFKNAVENDEYAELELSSGDILITDWGGDGTFNPYVELGGSHGDSHPTDILDEVVCEIGEKTGLRVRAIECDASNGVLVPDMERP